MALRNGKGGYLPQPHSCHAFSLVGIVALVLKSYPDVDVVLVDGVLVGGVLVVVATLPPTDVATV